MQGKSLKALLALIASGRKDEAQIMAVANDATKRRKLINAMQAAGIGVGVDPDNLVKWIELFFKYLPQVLALIKELFGKKAN